MSTRATITVSDEHDSFDIYQHHDGYPDGPYGLVRHIAMAQRLAWSPPRFEASDFAAAIISVLKDRGGSTYLTKDAALHSDRAFCYHVEPIRDDVSTHVQLTIMQPSWPKHEDDTEVFTGSIAEAVQKFDAVADTSDQPREWQILGEVDASLGRAEEEIHQWVEGTPDVDTQKTLDDIDGAGRNLMLLRDHLETSDPWAVLKRIKKILSRSDNTNPTQSLSSIGLETKLAVAAHKRFHRE
jgi:hypothetical protein